MESELRRELVPRQPLEGNNLEMVRRITSSRAVSVHIRRGDYVSNPITRAYHGLCGPDYYSRAVEQISNTVDSPNFFVFSDDKAWAKENFDSGFQTTFVSINDDNQDYADLSLISMCRHHIIANSSFSWWGAWLCNDPGKIVIAPRDWFRGANHDTSDLLPDTWVQL